MATVDYELVPMDDHIIVIPDTDPDASEGKHGKSVLLPKAHKKPPVRGTIAAVGPGKLNDDGTRVPMGLEKYEKIFFSRHSGEEVEAEGGKVVIMRRHEVLAVLKPKLAKGENDADK